MWYLLFKWLHVLAAIAALGSNITYSLWISSASRTPQTLLYTLQTIKMIDHVLANRAYAVLFVTGLIMVFINRVPITSSWLVIALVLYVVVGVLSFVGFTPNLRRQIALAETPGPESTEYQTVARRSNSFGLAIVVLVVAIVFLMVVKPHFWG